MKRFVTFLASTRLTVVLLLLLAVLVVWGTLYQADHGLYMAQKIFYRSYGFLAFGVVPFPGTQLVLFVLFLNLVSAMFVSIRYGWRRIGSILTHAGMLVLLVGGFVIGLFADESSLTLEEGEGSNVASSYNEWEVALWAQQTAGPSGPKRRVVATAAESFSPGEIVAFEDGGLRLEVESYYRNATPGGHDTAAGARMPLNSSGFRALRESPREKEPSADLPGVVFSVTDGQGDPVRVLLFGGDRVPTRVEIDGTTYQFSLRRKRRVLPFTVVLDDFQREMHPNSSMAKSFASEVTVIAGETKRPVRISMNEPLRYRGFTLYQSSYREMGGGREFSTFAVVTNRGRYLPYVGTFIVFAGLLVHFMMAVHNQRGKVA